MNRPPAFFKARELFDHKRILVFWLVALIALAAPRCCAGAIAI